MAVPRVLHQEVDHLSLYFGDFGLHRGLLLGLVALAEEVSQPSHHLSLRDVLEEVL